MSEAYLINTTFNDILKFTWPVILETDTLRLWYSLTSLLDNLDVTPMHDSNECRAYDSFTIVGVLDEDVPFDVNYSQHIFIDYHTLKKLHSKHCNVSDNNLHTIIDLFVTVQLPKIVSDHLGSLRLITLFDVTDFAELLRDLEIMNKYWLFRYKLVTMTSTPTTTTEEKKYEEKATTSEETEQENSSLCNDNFISQHLHIDSLKNNLELQFKLLHKYPEFARLRTMHAFVQLATGTVGLLEHMLNWN